MIIQDIEFELKDGRRAIIRSPKEEDIQGTLDYLNISAGETEFILRYPEECGKYTYEKEKALFRQLNASPDDAMMLCVVGGKVTGNCHLMFNSNIKTRHRAYIGIALIKEFWNLGIGTRLFREMIQIAKRRDGVTQLELDVAETNFAAIHLYEKMGFQKVGLHPKALRLKDGTYLDEYLMILELEK